MSGCQGHANLRPALFRSQTVEVANNVGGDTGVARLIRNRSSTSLGSNHGQFSGVEPVAAAVWALVHFDSAFRAEVVPVEFHA